MTRSTLWIGAACLLSAASAQAASYVMMRDEDLADQAPLIVQGRVLGRTPAADGSAAADFGLAVERVLKGAVQRSILTVRVPGGVDRRGHGLEIPGAPHFGEGERVLLMLGPLKDGCYAPWQLFLGSFHAVEATGRRLAVRDLQGAIELGNPALRAEPVRDLDRFADWLAERAAGRPRAPDYLATPAPSESKAIESAFTLYRFNGKIMRWFRFDDGDSAVFRPHESGSQVPELGLGELDRGIAAWNEDPNTNIRYERGSATSADKGMREYDDVNTVLWDDPHAEIAGRFDCRTGGVLAVGGPWYRHEPPGTYQGMEYLVITGGDIITNDGIGCFFARAGATAAEELLAHELGHTLGLRHSCDDTGAPRCRDNPSLDEALMRPTLHAGGRGARLGEDDREGILQLYPPDSGGGGCGLAVPARDGPSEGLGRSLVACIVALGLLLGRRSGRSAA